ncbi:trimeric intracellular cation channel family protein [Bacillus sp. Marseille-P3661]|uniref:trimeric intracellular cation channel family protein n=1 Tax=Bacillus sp. Marseille-P3661 TaxID=1936234 RepID=UPI000C81DB7E|nr:trimeric intracellular cation channel family protein [Bacillus sp. Marseille-P3661]
MMWDVFNVIGTIAFALSGAMVALSEECDYDLFGVYFLGFTCAFGGGTIRNLLIGVPVEKIWEQSSLFIIAFIAISLLFFFPAHLSRHFNKWGNLVDAVGLGAFAIQGALYAKEMGHPLSAIIVAALLTGCGGGIIRDLLAGRKPLVFRDELYASWTIVTAVAISYNVVVTDMELYGLFMVVTVLRLLSLRFQWRLPKARINVQA